MALQSITVTFPAKIKPETVVGMIEGSMKAASQYACHCRLSKPGAKENDFQIWAEGNHAFYQVGMIASVILQKFG